MSSPDVLTRDEAEALAKRVLSMVDGIAALVVIRSQQEAATSFARGDSHLAEVKGKTQIALSTEIDERHVTVKTDQIDDRGLELLVEQARNFYRQLPIPHRKYDRLELLPKQIYLEGPQTHFDATTRGMAPEPQSEIFNHAADAAEASSLIAAGDIRVFANSSLMLNSIGLNSYQSSTYGEFSLTARTPDGTGSGWAWSGYEDWARVDTQSVIDRAVSLARRSANPVAVEPGRYTVILEPAAIAALMEKVNDYKWWNAIYADTGQTIYAGDEPDTNKIGQQMLDRRVGMVSSPWDPEQPSGMVWGNGSPILGPVQWFEEGVLKNLAYPEDYARNRGVETVGHPGGLRLTVDGPTQSLEEMIASTKRGIWVNRLSHVDITVLKTFLMTGTTRDGTFLIEDGKITRPIKNFRFTESPFFVLNQLEAWGEPVRASREIVAPRIKSRDFNFTSLTDAI